jgi:type II secretion system protein N
MINRKTLLRRLALAAYFLAAFLVFLLLLFPFDRVKTRLESEVRQRSAFELSLARISPRFFNRFEFFDVVLADREGKVLFESPSVSAGVSLFGLLSGTFSADIKARAYGGDLLVKLRQNAKARSVQLDANGLDLGAYSLLKDLGFKLSGTLGGKFDMTGDAGKGRLWLKGLTSRELTIMGFAVPDLDFDQCWLEADLKGDRLMIRKFELDGKELKLRILGDLVLRERGTINLSIRLKPSEILARQQAGVLSLLTNKDAEGYYLFSLGGTLSEPLPRL